MTINRPKQEILRQADAVLKLCKCLQVLTAANLRAYQHNQDSFGHGLLAPRYLDRYYAHLAERLCFLLNRLRLLDSPVLVEQSACAPAVGAEECTLVCQGELPNEFLDNGIFELEISDGPTRLPDLEDPLDLQLSEFSLLHQRIVAAEFEMLRSSLASFSELLGATSLPEGSCLDGFDELLRIARNKLAFVVRFIDNSIEAADPNFIYALEDVLEVLPTLDVLPTTAVAFLQEEGIDQVVSSGLLRIVPHICHTRRISSFIAICLALVENIKRQEL